MNMIITREFVDMVAPEHILMGEECNDENLYNKEYGIRVVTVNGVEIERSWNDLPRCERCFLLAHVGQDTDDMEMIIIPQVRLRLKQPSY
ncbi:MAG: hypothetical protein WC343_08895 [Bacilli bacterium]|jgi:hypothetical protein